MAKKMTHPNGDKITIANPAPPVYLQIFAGWEEASVTQRGFDQLLEIGAIDDTGKVLRSPDDWQLIMAAIGQLHG